MKKIFAFVLLLGAFAFTQAQTQSFSFKSQYGNTVDTITNATKYMVSPDLGAGKFSSYTVVANYIEISGTTGGTAKLEYSLDGSIWSTLPVDSTFTATDAATNAYAWSIKSPTVFRYIRVNFTPTGTMSDKVYAKFIGVR